MTNKNQMDKKSIRGWYINDWAHSAHSTSVMVAIAPVYFVNLYKDVLVLTDIRCTDLILLELMYGVLGYLYLF